MLPEIRRARSADPDIRRDRRSTGEFRAQFYRQRRWHLTTKQRPDQNEISLALVPPEHTVIPPAKLEAEAHGLLDRALGVLQENHRLAIIKVGVGDTF
jgi:hypothetical protein